MTESPPDVEGLGLDGLKSLVVRLVEQNAALKAEIAALREEIARLKGLKGPPKLKPSGLEKASEPARAGRTAGRRGAKIDRLVIDEERVLVAAVPPPPPRLAVQGLRDLRGARADRPPACGSVPP